MTTERIGYHAFRDRVMTADEAARLIRDKETVATSGFGAGGTPKAVPRALAVMAKELHAQGEPFALRLFTGASTMTDVDGVLADADAVSFRMPYMSDPVMRRKINAGSIAYVDTHLSRVAPWTRAGFFGKIDVAIIEAALVRSDGGLVPTFAIGNAQTWLDLADKVIIEINTWHTPQIEGLHDIWDATIPDTAATLARITTPGTRVGQAALQVDPDKVAAVVFTHEPEQSVTFREDKDAAAIAGHILDFLQNEVARGRLPRALPPLQSGVGNIANAVMGGLADAPFENLTAYTEVIQDGMLDMLRSGRMTAISGAALYLSPDYADFVNTHMHTLRDKIVLRPQEVSNNPSVVRALNSIAMNAAIEVDIYGNVNSTRVAGSRVQNGIGGSGDFARSAMLSIFMTPSIAKNRAISSIVPMVSHVDHISQDGQVVVTEQGLADLRGLCPRDRARQIITHCAHPDYRPLLLDYVDRAERQPGGDTPHILSEALSWHQRLMDTGAMMPQ
jgi:succinyl-CoA:acetate CoA-transferase